MLFIGRDAELSQWTKILNSPNGCAVVVLGDAGMGKTRLLDKMVGSAIERKDMKCVAVRYAVSSDESPGMITRLILEDAFMAARARIGQLDITNKRFVQWATLFDNLKLVSHTTTNRYDFLNALRYVPQKHILDQFVQRLEFLSHHLEGNSRIIIVIDPRNIESSVRCEAWQQVFTAIPPRIILLFAQHKSGTFVSESSIRSLQSVTFIPDVGGLQPFTQEELNLLELSNDANNAIKVFDGMPFNVASAITLLNEGNCTLNELPRVNDPNAIAASLWKRLQKAGPDAQALLYAYVVLGVAVPDSIVCEVAEISDTVLRTLLADKYVSSLIRTEPTGRGVCHLFLRDYIRENLLTENGKWTDEAKRYHHRAVIVYFNILRRDLHSDPLATMQFPKHSLHAEGTRAFIDSLTYSERAFHSLGFYVTYGELLEQALGLIESGSEDEIDIRYLLGRLRMQQAQPEEAKQELNRAMELLSDKQNLAQTAKITIELGKLFLNEFQSAESKQLFKQAIDAYIESNDLVGAIEGRVFLSRSLAADGNIREGELLLLDSFNLCDSIVPLRNRQRAKASLHTALGRLSERQMKFQDATEQYHHALELTQYLYDREMEALLYNDMRDVTKCEGNLDNARKNQQAALHIHEELGMVGATAEDYYQLGILERRLQRVDSSRESLTKARDLFKQIGNAEKVTEIDLMLR
jgi:tetratricopeptide (TPR) repeat protein